MACMAVCTWNTTLKGNTLERKKHFKGQFTLTRGGGGEFEGLTCVCHSCCVCLSVRAAGVERHLFAQVQPPGHVGVGVVFLVVALVELGLQPLRLHWKLPGNWEQIRHVNRNHHHNTSLTALLFSVLTFPHKVTWTLY